MATTEGCNCNETPNSTCCTGHYQPHVDAPFIAIGVVLGIIGLATFIFIIWSVRRANHLRNLRRRPDYVERNIYVSLPYGQKALASVPSSNAEPIYETLDGLHGTPLTDRSLRNVRLVESSNDYEIEPSDGRRMPPLSISVAHDICTVKSSTENEEAASNSGVQERSGASTSREVGVQANIAQSPTSNTTTNLLQKKPTVTESRDDHITIQASGLRRAVSVSKLEDLILDPKRLIGQSGMKSSSSLRSLRGVVFISNVEFSVSENKFASQAKQSQLKRSRSSGYLLNPAKGHDNPEAAEFEWTTHRTKSLNELQRLRRMPFNPAFKQYNLYVGKQGLLPLGKKDSSCLNQRAYEAGNFDLDESHQHN